MRVIRKAASKSAACRVDCLRRSARITRQYMEKHSELTHRRIFSLGHGLDGIRSAPALLVEYCCSVQLDF